MAETVFHLGGHWHPTTYLWHVRYTSQWKGNSIGPEESEGYILTTERTIDAVEEALPLGKQQQLVSMDSAEFLGEVLNRD